MKKKSEVRDQRSVVRRLASGVKALAPHSALRLRSGSPTFRTPPFDFAQGLRHSAFTIIELVSVLAIIVVMLSIALGSYSGWTRAAGIDAAANLTATILGHAREEAITQRTGTHVTCGNFTPAGRPLCGFISVKTLDTNNTAVLAMPTNTLPAGVCFSNAVEQSLVFRSDGTCSPDPALVIDDGCAQFVIVSSAGNASKSLTRIVEVNQLSGRIRVRREGEP
jgi:type II secretory pathway pseudopilin PulG